VTMSDPGLFVAAKAVSSHDIENSQVKGFVDGDADSLGVGQPVVALGDTVS
jgi:hypothetical protein